MSTVSKALLDLWSHRDHVEETNRCASWVKMTDKSAIQSVSRGSAQVGSVCSHQVSSCLTYVWTGKWQWHWVTETETGGGILRSLWIAAQADWQETIFLPTLPTASVFSFHPLKVKDSWAFTTAMCLPREVTVNRDKVLLKEQDFHAAPRIKPAWHWVSSGRFLKQRVQWSLLIHPWQSCTEG